MPWAQSMPTAMLLSLALATSQQCLPHCVAPCEELNGDVEQECGACVSGVHLCRPAAPGFPTGGASPQQVHLDTSGSQLLSTAPPTANPHSSPMPPLDPGATRLDLLWATPVYSADLGAEMSEHHDELVAVISRRWNKTVAQLMPTVTPYMLNEHFHDNHRPALAAGSLPAYLNCGTHIAEVADAVETADAPKEAAAAEAAAARCMERVAASSVWPELLNSSGFRALFAGGRGRVWQHVDSFSTQLGLSSQTAGDGARVTSFSTWATHHARGVQHGKHGCCGSTLSRKPYSTPSYPPPPDPTLPYRS